MSMNGAIVYMRHILRVHSRSLHNINIRYENTEQNRIINL